jgi:hypothetical protein
MIAAVKVNRDGAVLDAGPAGQPYRDRAGADDEVAAQDVADASVPAARKWMFDVPTTGPHAAEPWWVARVPVTYRLANGSRPDPPTYYGRWQAYVPGPVEIVPWADPELLAGDALDTVPDDSVQLLASAPRLQPGGIPHR